MPAPGWEHSQAKGPWLTVPALRSGRGFRYKLRAPMNPASRYFVRVGPEVRGPYEVAQLRELAEVEVITPASGAAPTRDGPWAALATVAEAADIFPPRAQLSLAAAKFAPTPDAPEPVDLREVIARANQQERVLRPSHPPDLEAHFAAKAAAPPNEIQAMVRDVQGREAQFAPPPPPAPPWRPSRRLVLIGTLAVIGNGMLAAILTWYEGWNHDLSIVITTGLVVVLNGGLLSAYFILPRE